MESSDYGEGGDLRLVVEVIRRNTERARQVADELMRLTSSVSDLTGTVASVSQKIVDVNHTLIEVQSELTAIPELRTMVMAHSDEIALHTREISQIVVGSQEQVGAKLEATSQQVRSLMRSAAEGKQGLAIGEWLRAFGGLSVRAQLLLFAAFLALVAGWVIRSLEHL